MRPNTRTLINLLALAALLFCTQPAQAQSPLPGQPSLLKDINTCSVGENPDQLYAFNNVLYFSADDGVSGGHGRSLWRTDGTQSGTWMVKAGVAPDALVSGIPAFADAGGTLYFTTILGGGMQLWKTDGTTDGTVLVRDFISDHPGQFIANLKAAGSSLFFTLSGGGNTSPTPVELWRTDGTAEGTLLVKALLVQNVSAQPDLAAASLGGALYFPAYDAEHGMELWRSDGTADGTALYTDIDPGVSSANPKNLTPSGSRLYFTATDQANGNQLFATDGISGAAQPLAGLLISMFAGPDSMAADLSGGLYFTSFTEIWHTGGTPETTAMVQDIGLLETGFPRLEHLLMLAPGGPLFFTTQNNASDIAWWRTDGTPEGTIQLAVLHAPLPFPNDSFTIDSVFQMGDRVFLSLLGDYSSTSPSSIWASDGMPEGTGVVETLSAYTPKIGPLELTAVQTANGPRLFYRSYAACGGQTLHMTDGGVGHAQPVGVINSDTVGSYPNGFARYKGLYYFYANSQGSNFWVTDGTPEGTQPASDVLGLPSDLSVDSFNPVRIYNNLMYFAVRRNTPGELQIWRSDGTTEGTYPLATFTSAGYQNHFWQAGKWVYFFIDIWKNGPYELWKTDGTLEGTGLVTTLAQNDLPITGIAMDGIFYFRSEALSIKTWRTDGTDQGTTVIQESQRMGSAARYHMLIMNGQLYFTAKDDAHGIELWQSDGTSAGTHPLDLTPGPGSTNIASFDAINGRIVYAINDFGTYETRIYAAEPPFTTAQLLNAFPGVNKWFPIDGLQAIRNTIYFTVYNPTNHSTLWRTDGTPEGTLPLTPTENGYISAGSPFLLDDLVVFSAFDPVHGSAYWTTDGTPEGTRLLVSLIPPAPGRNPATLLGFANRQWFFRYDDGIHGEEVWVLPIEMLYRVYLGALSR